MAEFQHLWLCYNCDVIFFKENKCKENKFFQMDVSQPVHPKNILEGSSLNMEVKDKAPPHDAISMEPPQEELLISLHALLGILSP